MKRCVSRSEAKPSSRLEAITETSRLEAIASRLEAIIIPEGRGRVCESVARVPPLLLDRGSSHFLCLRRPVTVRGRHGTSEARDFDFK